MAFLLKYTNWAGFMRLYGKCRWSTFSHLNINEQARINLSSLGVVEQNHLFTALLNRFPTCSRHQLALGPTCHVLWVPLAGSSSTMHYQAISYCQGHVLLGSVTGWKKQDRVQDVDNLTHKQNVSTTVGKFGFLKWIAIKTQDLKTMHTRSSSVIAREGSPNLGCPDCHR